jgi:superfamily II DNA or RNA helicase
MLFPYQKRSNQEVLRLFDEGYRRVVDRMATGLGKTTKSRDIIRYFLRIGFKVLFVVDLDFVVDDTAAGLERDGIPCGIIQAGKQHVEANVYVCSLMTLIRRGLRPFEGEKVLFILDECHIFAGPECMALLQAYPESLHIGLTATPQRGDGTALGNFYEKMVDGPQMGWGMTHGLCSGCGAEASSCCGAIVPYLVPRVRTFSPPRFQKKLAWDPVDAWFQFAPGLRSLYFCDSAKHAEQVTEQFIKVGVGAETITSDTAARKRKGFRDRVRGFQTLVVCTHSVGIKALDLPEIACVGVWRPIKVQGVFQQMGGRACRRSVGKQEMVLIDGCGNVHELGTLEEDRVYSLDGDPIRVAHQRAGALCTCLACGAVQLSADACVRCGGTLSAQEVKVSKANQLVEIKEVPLDDRQLRQLQKLVRRGMAFVVPAAQRRQEAKAKRGEKTGRPVGPWLAVEWALAEFKKMNGVAPSAEVLKQMKTELYQEEGKREVEKRRELF